MASESRLYTFSPATKDALRKFRLSTSRAKDPQAVIYQINKSTLEIHAEDEGKVVHTSLAALADELPDNTPRFVVLSYPLTQANGRAAVPYVMLNYLPATCSSEMRMLYAGAKELMRNQAEVGRMVEIGDVDELEELEGVLKGEE